MSATSSRARETARNGSFLAVACVCVILVAAPAMAQQRAPSPTPPSPTVALLTEDPCCQFEPRLEFWLAEPAYVTVFQVYPGLGASRIYPHGSEELSTLLDRGRHGFRYLGIQANHARTVFDWHYGHFAPFRSSVQPFEHVVVVASDRPLTDEALASGTAFKHAPGDSDAGEVVARLVAAITPEGARIALDRGAWLRFAVPEPSTRTLAFGSALTPDLLRPIPIPFELAFALECDRRSDEHCTYDDEVEQLAGGGDAERPAAEGEAEQPAAEERVRTLLAEIARAHRRGQGPRIEVFDDPGSLLERPEIADRLRRALTSGRSAATSAGAPTSADGAFDFNRVWRERGPRSLRHDRPRRPRIRPERPSRPDRGSDRAPDGRSSGSSEVDAGES